MHGKKPETEIGINMTGIGIKVHTPVGPTQISMAIRVPADKLHDHLGRNEETADHGAKEKEQLQTVKIRECAPHNNYPLH